MKPVPAIVEPAQVDVDMIAEQIIVALAEHRGAESSAIRHEQLGGAARETARMKRIEIGRHLNKARPTWKERGPNARGWGEFLARVGLKESTARLYMDEAKDPDGFRNKMAKTRAEAGAAACDPEDDDEPVEVIGQERDQPPFRQMTKADWIQGLGRLPPDERREILVAAGTALELAPDDDDSPANVNGGSGDTVRATWRTSKIWAERIGSWDLDPFSNPRSVILSVARCMLEDGGDGFGGGDPGAAPGLYLTGSGHGQQPISGVADASTRVWLQPPYTNGFVERVVAHYGHTRFCALLRLDPSTEWFAALWDRTQLLAIPIGTREMFEAPPGIKSGSNPQPHAFYYSDPRDVTPAIAETCIVLTRYEALDHPALQLVR